MWTDRYTGTAEALAASGILPRELLPGEPGASMATASYRPQGVPVHKRPHLTPGYVQVFRIPSGTYRVELTVSVEEQERREAQRRAEDEADAEGDRRARLAATRSDDDAYTLSKAVAWLVRDYGFAAVTQHLAQLRGARPRRPAPDYLRLVWAAPN